ncbi:MAG: GumC family protein [Alphaproteobacteria bacterium]
MSEQFRRIEHTEVDLRAVFGTVARRLPFLIVIALVVGGATFAWLSAVDPIYRADTTILIETDESDITLGANRVGTSTLDREGIASRVELVRSRDVALAVISQLQLVSIAEFDPAQTEPSLIDRVMGLVGLGGDTSDLPVEELVLAKFREQLSVVWIQNTRVISVSFTSTDPQLAAEVANAVAQQYINLQRQVLQESTADATLWLEAEIATLSERVVAAETDVEAFRTQEDLFLAGRTTGQTPVTLVAQQLADISSELTRVQAARAEAEATADLIRANIESGTALSSLDVLTSSLIQDLRQQQSLLRTQIAEASATFLPGHPQIRSLNVQLADLEDAIHSEANNVLVGLENEAVLARGYEEELGARLSELKEVAAESNQAEVQLRALERVANAEGALLETYLALVREAVSRQNADFVPVNARIISPAAAPIEAFYPRPVAMTIIAIIITLMIGGAVLLVRELAGGRSVRPASGASPSPMLSGSQADGRVRWSDDSDVRRMMPRDPDDSSSLANRIEQSLNGIAAKLSQLNARRILITMADAAETGDRPLAAVALARTLARGGSRVLLIDLHSDDADRVAMGETGALPGFGDLYLGEASFAQVIFRDRSSPAHFIPAGKHIDLEEGERLTELTDALEQTYDHVLYDIGDRFVSFLAPKAGATVVLTEDEPSSPRTVAAYEAVKAVSTAEILLLVTASEPSAEESGAAA